jgi:hypothetical protein
MKLVFSFSLKYIFSAPWIRSGQGKRFCICCPFILRNHRNIWYAAETLLASVQTLGQLANCIERVFIMVLLFLVIICWTRSLLRENEHLLILSVFISYYILRCIFWRRIVLAACPKMTRPHLSVYCRHMLYWFFPLRINVLIGLGILVDNLWTSQIHWRHIALHALAISYWSLLVSSASWSSPEASHFKILFLCCFMMLQYDLIHRTVYSYMRLGSISRSSTCKKTALSTCGLLNPGTFDVFNSSWI